MKLSSWLPLPESPHVCVRIREDGDINNIEDRYALIEKTPRVRVRAYYLSLGHPDFLNWVEGNKGRGGPDGSNPANQLYGFYPSSREWCDAVLKLLGHELS